MVNYGQALTFGEVFTKYGSDKDTEHSYGVIYDNLFPAPDRAQVLNVLEIGIQWGASLKAFAEIFPNAHILGIDIDSTLFFGDRYASLRGDSTNERRMAELLYGKSFELIVDDGCHWLKEQRETYEILERYLSPGGIYVVEDLQTYEAMEYLAKIGFDVHDRRGVKGRQDDLIATLRKPEIRS